MEEDGFVAVACNGVCKLAAVQEPEARPYDALGREWLMIEDHWYCPPCGERAAENLATRAREGDGAFEALNGAQIGCGRWVRRRVDGRYQEQRCGFTADVIVWGKLFPEDALGPRCRGCAVEQIGSRAAWDRRGEYAVFQIPKPPKSERSRV